MFQGECGVGGGGVGHKERGIAGRVALLVERGCDPGAVGLLVVGKPVESAGEGGIAARRVVGFERQRDEAGSVAVGSGRLRGVVDAVARIEGGEAEAAVGLALGAECREKRLALRGGEECGIFGGGPEDIDLVEQWLRDVVAAEIVAQGGEMRLSRRLLRIAGQVHDFETEERGALIAGLGGFPGPEVKVLPLPGAGEGAAGFLEFPGMVEGRAGDGAETILGRVVAGEDDER